MNEGNRLEADWEVEIGPSAAVIEGLWTGFLDLVTTPERVKEIVEVGEFPPLAKALLRLNGPAFVADGPLVWTSKCDVWSVEECDSDEFDSNESDAACGFACYIDLLPRGRLLFAGVPDAENWARHAVSRLRTVVVRRCRVDLVIRRAFVGSMEGCGISAYVAGCGSNAAEARDGLAAALDVFAEILSPNRPGL